MFVCLKQACPRGKGHGCTEYITGCRIKAIAKQLAELFPELPESEIAWLQDKVQCAYKHMPSKPKAHLVQAGYYSPVE